MIRVGNIRVPLDADFSDIAGIASKKLKIPRDKIKKAVLSKKSVDEEKNRTCTSLFLLISKQRTRISF